MENENLEQKINKTSKTKKTIATLFTLGAIATASIMGYNAYNKEEIKQSLPELCEAKGEIYKPKKARESDINFSNKEIWTKGYDDHKQKNGFNKNNEGTLEIYFGSDDSSIMTNDLNDLYNYIKSYNGVEDVTILIEGRADDTYTSKHNEILSKARVNNTKKTIEERILSDKRINLPNVKIQEIAYGENNPISDDNYRNRSARLKITDNPIQELLNRNIAENYVIDDSASMTENVSEGKSRMEYIRKCTFPKDNIEAKNPVISLISGNNCGSTIDSLTDDKLLENRGTPLYDRMLENIKSMDDGERMTVLTDGYDFKSKNEYNTIINSAMEKNIGINIINLRPEQELIDGNYIKEKNLSAKIDELKLITSKTGGDYTFYK